MWHVKINPLVLKEDFKNIPASFQKKILRAIQKKLTIDPDPEAYGKPLRGEYAGYWRLRVENYRVVYRIKKKQILIFVIKIGIRKDDRVYRELMVRLKKLQ